LQAVVIFNVSDAIDLCNAVKMNDEGKVERMTKVWNASGALRELGWM